MWGSVRLCARGVSDPAEGLAQMPPELAGSGRKARHGSGSGGAQCRRHRREQRNRPGHSPRAGVGWCAVTPGARKSSADLDELAGTGQVRVVLADLADPAGPASLIEQAGDRIDVLVNNVGGAPARTGGFLSITDADWHATIELDLMAAVRTTRAALRAARCRA